MAKKKIILRVAENEAAIVGTFEQWEHLIATYNLLAEDAPNQEQVYWHDAAAWVQSWLKKARSHDSRKQG